MDIIINMVDDSICIAIVTILPEEHFTSTFKNKDKGYNSARSSFAFRLLHYQFGTHNETNSYISWHA